VELVRIDDLIRAYGLGFLYMGRIGIFGKWKAFRTAEDFYAIVRMVALTKMNPTKLYNECFKIEEMIIDLQ
jgi:hypothetical protein